MRYEYEFLVIVLIILLNTSLLRAQWILQESHTNEIISDVVMLDSTTAIAVGRDRSILRTTDSGKTWINLTAPFSYSLPWNNVSFFDKENGIVVGDNGGVFVTTNGGLNWGARYIPKNQKCLSALHIGPTNIYVGTDSGWVYNSVDTGKTWFSEQISTEPIHSIFAWRGPFILGLPVYALTSHFLYYKLEFPLTSWAKTNLPVQGLGSVAFDGEFCNGGGAGFIVGVQGDFVTLPLILRKAPQDTAWNAVPHGIHTATTLVGISAPSDKVIYVCGTNGVIYKSTDGGDTWNPTTVPTTHNLNAIYFFNEERGFAVGDYGVILYTSNGGITGINEQENNLPRKFHLGQNYPNPFNATTVIDYSLTENSYVTLKVYDLLGRETKKLVSEFLNAGTYSATFEADDLASGVYFYHLQIYSLEGGVVLFTETKKLILLR
jgi:photosystem II stability/assembly factor-like uncharacterized protein